MTPPYQSYFRVWSAVPHSEADHAEFHRQLWAARSDAPVCRLILDRLELSAAADADKLEVTRHTHADWQVARVLASMASSCTASDPGDFPARLTALREAAGLSIPELARKADVSDDAVRLYEKGERSPTWDAVQKIAAALNVPTDAFRTS